VGGPAVVEDRRRRLEQEVAAVLGDRLSGPSDARPLASTTRRGTRWTRQRSPPWQPESSLQSSVTQRFCELQTSPVWQSASPRQRPRQAPLKQTSASVQSRSLAQARSQRCSLKVQTRPPRQSEPTSQKGTMQRPQTQASRDRQASSPVQGFSLTSDS
jgi:hypothetical protein